MNNDNRSAKKKREKIERRKRYVQQKAFSDAMKRGPCDDPALAERQRKFCVRVVKDMLEDDNCYSFSKPVTELWDISELPGYFDKVKKPMDLGTCLESLQHDHFNSDKTGIFDFRLLVDNVHLVFKNCLEYNEATTDLAKLSRRLMTQFDRRLRDIPLSSSNKSSDLDGKESDGENPDDQSEGAHSDDDDNAGSGAEDEEMSAAPENDQEEADQLNRELSRMKKSKAKSEGILAELEMERNMPMTAEDRMKLRDDVESAPWEKVEQVGRILQKHVDKAVEELGKSEDSIEYVMLELNDVEPYLLRQVEDVVRPSAKRQQETAKIKEYERSIADLEGKLKSLKGGIKRRR